MAQTENSLHNKLIDIQQRLKVPKEQSNDFGGFKYRNIEDIEDKLKPLLKEHGLIFKFNDEMVAVGDRIYVKATAILSDGEKTIEATAYAREAQTPKAKTDDSQLTGSCSSYARKYAASGLFLIDNTKDADSNEHNAQSKNAPEQEKPQASETKEASEKQKDMVKSLGKQLGYGDGAIKATLANIKTSKQASDYIVKFQERLKQPA